MDAETMMQILKKEYGINSREEFEKAYKECPRIDISIFTNPIKRESKEVTNTL